MPDPVGGGKADLLPMPTVTAEWADTTDDEEEGGGASPPPPSMSTARSVRADWGDAEEATEAAEVLTASLPDVSTMIRFLLLLLFLVRLGFGFLLWLVVVAAAAAVPLAWAWGGGLCCFVVLLVLVLGLPRPLPVGSLSTTSARPLRWAAMICRASAIMLPSSVAEEASSAAVTGLLLFLPRSGIGRWGIIIVFVTDTHLWSGGKM